MQEFDGPGLKDTQKILGLSSKPGFRTDFDSDVVQQVLDVQRIIRRGRAHAQSTGIWHWQSQLSHAVADTQTLVVDPYNFGSAFNGYPVPVPEGYDVWLIGPVTLVLNALALNMGTMVIASAIAGHLAATTSIPVGIWDNDVSLGGGAGIFGVSNNNPILFPSATRLHRGATLDFTTISSAAMIAQFRYRLGVFAAGLGQDALGEG